MQRDARAYLWHVWQAAEAIERFVAGLDSPAQAGAEVVHSAVERKFEIIGEALGQLTRLDATLATRIPHVRAIVGFRNLLIHGYATVQHERVWEITQLFLPELRATTAALLEELGPPD